jgi:hypothetical protein
VPDQYRTSHFKKPPAARWKSGLGATVPGA